MDGPSMKLGSKAPSSALLVISAGDQDVIHVGMSKVARSFS